jgi:hypothetical protein
MNLASDKAAIFEQCFGTDSPRVMPDPNEPKKETVRIAMPPRLAAEPPGADTKSHEKAPQFVPPSPPFPVSSPSLPAPAPPPAQVSPAPTSLHYGLKKETARIPLMPDPVARPAPTVRMKKTQPLIAMPHVAPQNTSIAVEPAQSSDAIPMPICWTLLVVSAVILIIQIWTYLS